MGDHLKHVPKYMLPRGMEVNENVGRKKRKKKTRSQRMTKARSERNKANDPLQSFDGDVNMEGLLAADADEGEDSKVDEDKFFEGGEDADDEEIIKKAKNQAYLDDAGDDGFGNSISGRNAWKLKHSKGKFNRNFLREKHEQLHKW